MSSFWRGLRNSNPLILGVAALLVFPAMFSLEDFFTSGRWTLVPLEQCLRIPRDDFTYVSWTVGRAKQAPPKGPALYLLGGSSARESIVSGDALADDIADLGGPSITAYDLGSSNQTFAESLAVVDNVPDTPAWVVIGVSKGRFVYDMKTNLEQVYGRELLLESPTLERFAVEEWGADGRTMTILPGIFTYLVDLATRQSQRVLAGNPIGYDYQLHAFYDSDEVLSVKRKDRLAERQTGVSFRRNMDVNLRVLEALMARCQERGLRAVVVELPLNEEVVQGRWDDLLAEYQRPVREMAKRYDIPYLDFNDEVGIPNTSFRDLTHLIESGGEVWQRRLARELVPLMNAAEATP